METRAQIGKAIAPIQGVCKEDFVFGSFKRFELENSRLNLMLFT